jgi:hypothetical protein
VAKQKVSKKEQDKKESLCSKKKSAKTISKEKIPVLEIHRIHVMPCSKGVLHIRGRSAAVEASPPPP